MPSLSFKAQVPVFDANVCVGELADKPADNLEELLAEMHRHGIDRAVIHHIRGEEISDVEANRELVQWAKGNQAFSLQWVAGPGEDCLKQLQEFHSDGKVQSVRLHNTGVVRLPFVDWLYGDLLEWLTAEHIPLWVSLADTPVTEIMDTLRRFPDLVTLLLGAHYLHTMYIRPLLRNLPKAHMELSRFENLDGIEELKEDFGLERFVYGSYYPRYAMGPMLFYIHHMNLNRTELTAFCAGNLERILAGSGNDD